MIFAILVSDGITRPVRRLLEGTRAVEAGRLDGSHRGIIDKYIGDAIMAYWGPPFIDEADQARFACFAAIDMIGRIGTLRKELSELLGVRTIYRYRRGIGRQHRLRIYDELHRYGRYGELGVAWKGRIKYTVAAL